MFRTHSKKIIGDVRSRKGRTLLVSAAIFVGVAGTIALFTMSDALISQLEQDIQEDRLAMAQITSVYSYQMVTTQMGGVILYFERPGAATEEPLPVEDRSDLSDY